MKPDRMQQRRRLIKIALALPILTNPLRDAAAAYNEKLGSFSLSDEMLTVLRKIYGRRALTIDPSDQITLKVPNIAENGAVVPVSVIGDPGFVSSFVIFVASNRTPLASTCFLHDGADVKVSLRLKVDKTSDVILVADSNQGLVACKKLVKVTIGCGGG